MKKTYIKKILLLLMLFFVNICFSQDSIQAKKIYSVKDLEKEIKLNNDWKTKVGNNLSWKETYFNDEDWKTQPAVFFNLKDPAYNGEIWFRQKIHIDSSLINVPVSLIFNSKANASVYLNGEYLGIFGKAEVISNPDNEKNHPVVFAFKNAGEHIFAVHYKDSISTENKSAFSSNGFKLSLVTPEKYLEKTEMNHYLWLAMTAVGMMFITLGFIHFILFGFYRKFIANLLFGIFNLCSGMSILLGYSTILRSGIDGITFTDMVSPYSIIFSLIGGLAISATVNFLFNKNKIFFYILVGLSAVSLVLTFIVSKNFMFLCQLITSATMLEAIIIVVIATINKKTGAKIIAFGLVCSFCFALLLGMFAGIIFGMQKMNTVILSIIILLMMLSFFSTPFAMSAFLASNFASVSRKLQAQLKQVNKLSDQALNQEKERKNLLENKMTFLETEVKERTKEIEIQKQQIEKQQTELLSEKQKSEDLLLNILPKDIADELKESGESKVKQFSSVSILFSDFTNLDSVSQRLNSQELLDELNHCFQAFDHITTKHQIEKIKTISYSYMAVSGLPLENDNHAKKMIEVALEMCDFITTYQEERRKADKPYFEIKIGINSGEVVAGIVGIKKFAYDIWGDAVNTAARMKARSENGKINVGSTTYELAKEYFDFSYRGELEIKGKGLAKMYFVETKTN